MVLDDNMNARYFSRSVIPYLRGVEQQEWASKHQYYAHIGLYAYRAAVLERVTQLPASSLEVAESLEQLRWLQNGFVVKTAVSQAQTIGIDTPDDLRRAEQFVIDNNL